MGGNVIFSEISLNRREESPGSICEMVNFGLGIRGRKRKGNLICREGRTGAGEKEKQRRQEQGS